ncbi:MAG: UvrD-helicase domain-containing protein [Ruminococcus sp.]
MYPYEAGDLVQHAQLMPLLLELEEQLTAEIWQQKVQQNALAFDDAERMALELLAELSPEGTIQPSALAKELQAYYQLIMIDEYQDSNNKQDDIFKLLSRNCIEPETGTLRYGDNVFLVGDVKQSIYRFRLATPELCPRHFVCRNRNQRLPAHCAEPELPQCSGCAGFCQLCLRQSDVRYLRRCGIHRC